MATLSKAYEPDNFELHNSLKLSFTRILLIVNLSLNQTLLTFLLCMTNLDDSFDSGNFSVRGYLPLIQKYSSTHMYGLAVYVKEFVLQWFSLHWETDYIVAWVSIDVPSFATGSSFHCVAYDLLIGMVFVIIWEMFRGRLSSNLVLLLLLVNFCYWG